MPQDSINNKKIYELESERIFTGEQMNALIDLAKKNRVAKIIYQKASTDLNPHPRLIEPYSLTQGKQDIMLRAYQLDPEEGWRYFMFHKITQISDGDKIFTPRRRMSFIHGIVAKTYEPYEAWNESVQEYRNIVLNCLADYKITKKESFMLENFKSTNNITPEQMRSVHASIFSNCLNHIISDGIVDTSEEQQLFTINVCLSACGWGILNKTK